MKTSLALLLGLFSISLHAHPFIGTWYFVKGSYTDATGNTSHATNSQVAAIKNVTQTQFVLTNAGNGQFNGYLAGDFNVTKGGYSEAIKTGSSEAHLAKTFHFTGYTERVEVDNKVYTYWHHKGEVNGVVEQEVWRKIESIKHPIETSQ